MLTWLSAVFTLLQVCQNKSKQWQIFPICPLHHVSCRRSHEAGILCTPPRFTYYTIGQKLLLSPTSATKQVIIINMSTVSYISLCKHYKFLLCNLCIGPEIASRFTRLCSLNLGTPEDTNEQSVVCMTNGVQCLARLTGLTSLVRPHDIL